MLSLSVCLAVRIWNISFMAERMAACRAGSSSVGESLQTRLPFSSRFRHRHTYRFSPLGIQSRLRYGLPHSPQTNISFSAYLPLYLPSSVLVLEEVFFRPARRASSSCTF